jgi:2-isopropylmalate synthase
VVGQAVIRRIFGSSPLGQTLLALLAGSKDVPETSDDDSVYVDALASVPEDVLPADIIIVVIPMEDDQSFDDLVVACGTNKEAVARVKIKIDNDEIETNFSSKDGPVDAIFNAIKKLIPHSAVLDFYQIQAVTKGIDAQATAVVRLKQNNRICSANGSDTNVLIASAIAYINCLNKMITNI